MTDSNFIFDATEQNFQQGVIENSYKAPVLLDFWAEWCQPCKQLIPILEKLVSEFNGQFILAKVNSETQQALSQQFQVRSIPTVFIFKNGEVVEQFNGLQPEERIREMISKHITTEADIKRSEAMQLIQNGDFDSATACLLEAEKIDPEHAGIQIDLAHIEAKEKHYENAEQRLAKLKPADREKPEVISLLNQIELAKLSENAPAIEELRQQIEKDPVNSLARFQLATQLIHQQQYEEGLEHLLFILQRDRNFQDGIAQKTLLSTFSLLGDDNPLVGQYRRKMFSAMH